MVNNAVVSESLCQVCGERTEPGMRFCLNCGAPTGAVPDSPQPPRTCPKCTFVDSDSLNFCVYCGAKMGAKMDAIVPTFKRAKNTFFWNKPSTERPKLEPRKLRSLEKIDLPPARIISAGAVAAAILLGGAAGIALFSGTYSQFVSPLVEPYFWKRQSLIVYASPAGAQVNIWGEKDRSSAFGKIPSSGSVSFNNLPAGKYMMTIEAPEHQKVVGLFSLSEDSPTVIGFPNRLVLPPDRLTEPEP